MAKIINKNWIKNISVFFVAVIIVTASLDIYAVTAERVTTQRDSSGWKLLYGGEDYYVKGVVWGYSPRGENYTYNLWGQSEEFIKMVLDKEFGLMKKANINSIRAFSTIPPKWVTYAYEEYGITTSINPLMGRYGANINGKWKPVTDYSILRLESF